MKEKKKELVGMDETNKKVPVAEKDVLRMKLEDIIIKIKRKKEKLMDIENIKMEIKKEHNHIANELKSKIADEKDEAGKPAFSNQQKRDAEFEARIKDNVKYIECEESLESYKVLASKINIDIEELNMIFRMEEIISRLTGGLTCITNITNTSVQDAEVKK